MGADHDKHYGQVGHPMPNTYDMLKARTVRNKAAAKAIVKRR
jgi:hypothetical protein